MSCGGGEADDGGERTSSHNHPPGEPLTTIRWLSATHLPTARGEPLATTTSGSATPERAYRRADELLSHQCFRTPNHSYTTPYKQTDGKQVGLVKMTGHLDQESHEFDRVFCVGERVLSPVEQSDRSKATIKGRHGVSPPSDKNSHTSDALEGLLRAWSPRIPRGYTIPKRLRDLNSKTSTY